MGFTLNTYIETIKVNKKAKVRGFVDFLHEKIFSTYLICCIFSVGTVVSPSSKRRMLWCFLSFHVKIAFVVNQFVFVNEYA